MKKLTKALLILLVLFLGMIVLTGCSKEETKQLKVQDFKNALESNGLVVTEEIPKAAGMVGAEEGYGYKINGVNIEVYQFNERNNEELAKENIKKAKDEGKIVMPSFGNYTFDAVYNKGLALTSYDKHPDAEKIISIFKGL